VCVSVCVCVCVCICMLVSAVICEHVDVVRLLLDRGARVDTLDEGAGTGASPALRSILERAQMRAQSPAAAASTPLSPTQVIDLPEDSD
jgi:hypothetical protein